MSERSIGGRRLADALLRPRIAAVYGASGDPKKNTGRPQRFLKTHGFTGQVIPINPNRDEVQGVRAYPTLAAAPRGVEHALIMVPKRAVLAAVEDCAVAGVKVATIYSDGFAETGPEGAELQRRIVDAARAGGVRIVGPNSMGVIDLNTPLTLSINAILEMGKLPAGRLGVISQSGSLLGALISRGAGRGVGFSSLLSIGNEADLGVGELIDLLVDEPMTDAIALFLEGIRDCERVAHAARRAFAAGKPVVAYKLGRSDVGRELAVSHSGAVAGPDSAVDAFMRHHGILRVDMLETLLELPALARGMKPGAARRVAVITTTGGGAATIVDRLGAAGMELVPATPRLRERLSEFGMKLGHGRLIDLTMAGARPDVYGATLEVLLNEDAIDAVVAVVGSSGQFQPEIAVSPIINVKKTGKPLACFIAPDAPESLKLLAAGGVAAFRTPEACADAVRALVSWRAPAVVAAPDVPLAAVAKALGGAKGPILDEARARGVMKALGVPVSEPLHLAGPDAEIPDGVAYPVAAKVLSADLPHKTEAGAVALGLKDEAELKAAMAGIWASAKAYKPDAGLDGILVEPMVSALAEVLLGYRFDAEAGPVVVLGMGGILTEIYEDAAVRPAPVDRALAREMIEEVKGLACIRGYRNLPKGDLDALADAIVAVSALALVGAPRVAEAEINPLMVRGTGAGVVAVDALVRL
ncbi:MAG: acetate--CoA ligase family protein [Rhodospirillaceae bacterium]